MFLRFVAAAALLAGPLYAQAPARQQAPAPSALPDAREIIDRHIKAIGGRDAVLSHKSMHMTGKFSVPSAGISGPAEIFGASNPDRTFVKMTVPGIGEILEGFDGSHGWSVSPVTGPMLKVGKELTQTKLDSDFYGELRDPKKYTSMKTVEKTTFPSAQKTTAPGEKPAVEGRPCYKIALTRIDGVEDFDFYDVETGLFAGRIATRESPMGPVTATSVVSGYKKFGNLLQATTQSQTAIGVEQLITVTAIEYDNVDASAFEPPAAIKALIK